MRFLAWNMALAGWLLFSAFALPHSPGSAALTGLLAVLIGTIALCSPGLKGLRFANAGLAVVLATAALLMPDVGWLARIHDLLMAATIFALSIIPGTSWSGAALEQSDPRPPG
jgi:hypothetical protein